jgi:uncharacterized damage-inducible protein DinB
MQWKHYIIETFQFNDQANKRLLEKIKVMPDKEQAIKYLSHLINCQYKWMARIKQAPQVDKMDWWDPVYELSEIEDHWNKSLAIWIDYVVERTDEELLKEVTFPGYDGGIFAATPKDIALQLNYHSIHHRAQVQSLIRQQGLDPDFLDYIGTRYRKLT